MATLATRLVEQVLARQHLWRADVAAGRHRQVAGVERDQAQDVVADFFLAIGTVAVGRSQAAGLCRSAIVVGQQGAGQAHVAGKGVHVLLVDVGLPGFPAEAADHCFALGVVPHTVGPPADAIAVTVVRVFVGQQVGFGDRFKQAQADHRWCHPRRKARVGVHHSIAELGDLQGWLAQLDLMAVLE
ncbi:hypothetical protein D3C79_591390 [compost metagenome]